MWGAVPPGRTTMKFIVSAAVTTAYTLAFVPLASASASGFFAAWLLCYATLDLCQWAARRARAQLN